MAWADTANAVIRQMDASLPADADLKARKRALSAARPYEFRVTSWGKKVWAKCAREYLAKHGQPPRTTTPIEAYLSPLERAKRASEAKAALAVGGGVGTEIGSRFSGAVSGSAAPL